MSQPPEKGQTMSTLPHAPAPVNSDRDVPALACAWVIAGLEWPAVLDEVDHAPSPDLHTDAAWLWEEASVLSPVGARDRLGARELAADCAADLVHLLKAARTQSAGEYLSDPSTPVSRADLAAAKIPAAPFATPFVAELVDLACYYLQEGRLAAELLGFEILSHAVMAERFKSASVTEYVADEAAYRAAVEDEVLSGGDWN